jgi:hypothetical protein
MRDALRAQHYALRTEQAYVDWARRYILFHHKRHPKEMGKPEIEAFLTHLAVERQVAASTQNQAASALLFLYRHVVQQPIDELRITRARKPEHLPTVLTKSEVLRVLHALSGVPQLMAKLLYGSGLPLTGHTDRIWSLAFSPDGQTLASASRDGPIFLWDMRIESWQARACQIAARNFTHVEWAQYFSGEVYRKACAAWPEGEP